MINILVKSLATNVATVMVNISDPNVVQTEEMCMEAVKQDGYALKYVHNQTEEICICAVKQNGIALGYVHNQTEEICMCAVKQDAGALEYVINQTDAICLEAIYNYFKQGSWWYTVQGVYNTIEYPSPQLINQIVKLYPLYINPTVYRYEQNIIKTYKAGSDAICADLVPHANDLLYRPNYVNALVHHTRWHEEQTGAKTVFLTKS